MTCFRSWFRAREVACIQGSSGYGRAPASYDGILRSTIRSPALSLGLALILIPSSMLVGLEIYQIARNVPELRRSQELVAHTVEVTGTIQALERAIQDAERGQRGFLITGNPTYLDPYRTGVQEISDALAKVKQLTVDNPEQQRRWPVLEQQINVKLDELKRTIDARQSEGFDAARRIVETNVGVDAMRAIDQIIDAAAAAEN